MFARQLTIGAVGTLNSMESTAPLFGDRQVPVRGTPTSRRRWPSPRRNGMECFALCDYKTDGLYHPQWNPGSQLPRLCLHRCHVPQSLLRLSLLPSIKYSLDSLYERCEWTLGCSGIDQHQLQVG